MDEELASGPESWVDRHGDALFRFAVLRVRDRTIAEDLVQDTLLAAMQAVGSLTDVANERSWLIGILRHKLLDHFRRTFRERKLWDDEAADVAASDDDFDDNGRWMAPPGKWSSPSIGA
jgi:RNA polymerase sigma-70 factor (ECF subfamily)